MNNEIKEILDYLKEFIDEDRLEQINLNRWFISSLLAYITNLQQENERLKLELSGYREAILRDDKLLGLQQRIEKAVEYIEKATRYSNIAGMVEFYGDTDELLDILRGEE